MTSDRWTTDSGAAADTAITGTQSDPGPGSADPDVDGLITAFEETARDACVEAMGALDRELGDTLIGVAVRAADSHATLLGEAGFGVVDSAMDGGSNEPDSAEGLWRRIRAYVTGVRADVIEPLRDVLGRTDVAGLIAAHHAALDHAIIEAAVASPEEVSRPLAPDVFRPKPGDNPIRRLRKAGVRWWRAGGDAVRSGANAVRRAVRLAPRQVSPPVQVVPMRLLLEFHARQRLARANAEAASRLRVAIASRIGDLERELPTAVQTLLDLDRGLDDVRYHRAPPSSPGSGDGDTAAVTDVRAAAAQAAAAARSIDGVVRALATIQSVGEVAGELRDGIVTAGAALRADVEHADTFMLDRESRTPAPGRARRPPRDDVWAAWYDAVVARLDLVAALAGLREELLAALDDGVQGATAATELAARPFDACLTATSSLRIEAAGHCDTARAAADPSVLVEQLRDLPDRARAIVESTLIEPLEADGLRQAIVDSGDRTFDRILTALGRLPEALEVHPPAAAGERIDPVARTARVRPRELAGQAIDAMVLERIRTAPQPIAEAVDEALDVIRGFDTVHRFHIDTAIRELQTEEGDGLGAAEELALGGLDRALEGIEAQRARVLGELAGFSAGLFQACTDGWHRLHRRIRVEDRVQEQMLDVRHRLGTALRRATARTVTEGTRVYRAAVVLGGRGRSRVEALVRRSQSVVSGERITDEEHQRTIAALSTIHHTLADLPLVYRRLFSFDPVLEADLLVGRGADLELVGRHYEQWRAGRTNALVITGFDGNGRTSFLNVVVSTILRDMDVRRVRFESRVLDEDGFVERVATALELPIDAPPTLDGLTERIRTRPPGPPLACVIENLEHLFLRTASGNGPIGAVLGFMSRTDPHILWIGSLAEQAWDYIEKIESGTARLVRRHPLSSLQRNDIETLIMNRHARSGLACRFDPPDPIPPMLRRRLSRAANDAERQRLLRADYFDRLARATGQNLLLSIFYWLQSIVPEPGSGTVRVLSLRPLSFGFLDDFTIHQSFTLKAFLEHATLTLDEHDTIFRVPRSASRNLFELLGNLLLIETAETRDRVSDFRFTTVDENSRYRIRPLVVHPVTMHLRERNLVG